MPSSKNFTRSFAGGELSAEMFGRIDDAKYQSGAALMQNFIATPQGPAQNRAGFAYVLSTKANGIARLIPFVYSNTQTMVVEFGNQYVRFHTQGETLEASPGVPYEVSTPYLTADLFDIHYVQSADVMTLVHPSYPPMELKRLGATNWTLTPINFGTAIDTPQNVAASASPGYKSQIVSATIAASTLLTTEANHTLSIGDGIYILGLIAVIGGVPTDLSGFYQVNNIPVDGMGNLIKNQLGVTDYNGIQLDSSSWDSYSLSPGTIQLGDKVYDINSYYAVAAIAADNTSQSALSASATALDNLDVPGSYNVITWDAVPAASRYYVFKQKNGLWGYIGEAIGTTFTDNNIAPDFTITPVNLENPFVGANNYPAAVSYIEQRRTFGGSNNAPQTILMTNSGTESTLAYSLPVQDTDRISVKIASREVSAIQHIIPLDALILLTNSAEYAEFTANDGPITPSSIGFRAQSYIGSSNVQPTVVNNLLVYCAARGGHVRELGYNLQSNGYLTGDLSLRTANLFDNLTIVDQAFSKAPLPIVWFVSSNGNLLGLTYVPEQQIGAWHHHVTDGVFESIACVAEGNEERLYAVIRRVINGETVRYVERMASRLVGDLQDCFFVDAGATYSGIPATTITGLDWLEGKTVAVLADGAVQNQKVVANGTIVLDHEASVVQIGLPYICDLQTLPPALQVDGYGQGRQMNVNKVWIRLFESSGLFAGNDSDSLYEFKQRTIELYGQAPALQTGQAEITLVGDWNMNGQVLIRQSNPLPLTVVSLTAEISVGG